jgi:hypothetical protein
MQTITNLDLVTAVYLNPSKIKPKKTVYQFIYAGQLYGTFFAVFATFKGKKTGSGPNESFVINKMHMELVNYKGIVNIGFTKRKPEWRTDDPNLLEFFVRGASRTVNQKHDFGDQPIIVKKGELRRIIFGRTLLPLPAFEKYLKKRSSNSGRLLDGEPPIAPVFDSEYNTRDGIDFYDNDIRPGLSRLKGLDAVGYRCNTSNVNFIF